MSTDKELDLGPIEERLKGISKGDWVDDTDGDTGDLTVQMGSSGTHNIYFSNLEGSCGECHANARFIANAPADIAALVAEVKRLREDRASCIKGLKELKDNALTAMRSYPMHSEGWFDFSRRAQAYENAYIRATNMLNWNGSGKSFVHFKEE